MAVKIKFNSVLIDIVAICCSTKLLCPKVLDNIMKLRQHQI